MHISLASHWLDNVICLDCRKCLVPNSPEQQSALALFSPLSKVKPGKVRMCSKGHFYLEDIALTTTKHWRYLWSNGMCPRKENCLNLPPRLGLQSSIRLLCAEPCSQFQSVTLLSPWPESEEAQKDLYSCHSSKSLGANTKSNQSFRKCIVKTNSSTFSKNILIFITRFFKNSRKERYNFWHC